MTLGPKGRNVIIQKSFGSPTVTKDGVTVAKEIELEDKYENMGAKMVKEVASKTTDVAGDGTTTATVLAEAIYNEGLKAVVAGVNPMLMKRGIDKAVEDIVEQLHKMSTKVTDQDRDRAGRDRRRQQRLRDRQDDRRGHGEGRQGRRHHRRGRQDASRPRSSSSRACSSTAATCRPYFVTNPTDDGGVLEDAYILIHEKKISQRQGPGAGAREGRPDRQAAPDHRRGRRGRGPGHAGRQQAPRHLQRAPRSRPPATATAARPCSRTSPS